MPQICRTRLMGFNQKTQGVLTSIRLRHRTCHLLCGSKMLPYWRNTARRSPNSGGILAACLATAVVVLSTQFPSRPPCGQGRTIKPILQQLGMFAVSASVTARTTVEGRWLPLHRVLAYSRNGNGRTDAMSSRRSPRRRSMPIP